MMPEVQCNGRGQRSVRLSDCPQMSNGRFHRDACLLSIGKWWYAEGAAPMMPRTLWRDARHECARAAATKGASLEEAADAIGVSILMGGGPASIYAPRAYAAFKEFHDAL